MLTSLTRLLVPNLLRGSATIFRTPARRQTSDYHNKFASYEEEEDAFNNREFEEVKIENFEKLYINDSTGEIKEKIEKIINDYEFVKYNSMGRVPVTISIQDMKRILAESQDTLSARGMIHYFFKREMSKRAFQRKKEETSIQTRISVKAKQEALSERYGSGKTGLFGDKSDELIYGLWHNCLFPRITEGTIKERYLQNLVTAAQFGPKLIFDFDFEETMPHRQLRGLAEQIMESYGVNRYRFRGAFDLWFCNFNKNTTFGSYMQTVLPNLYDNSMITIKEDCFTNHFDKSRLVYLSPDAPDILTGPIGTNDDVYIMGAIVDSSRILPLTYRKAQLMGIRSKRLPIDQHVAWKHGTKCLCLNQVTGLLASHYLNNDWSKAMENFIPRRKMKSLEELQEENERRKVIIETRLKRPFDYASRAPKRKFSFKDDFFDSDKNVARKDWKLNLKPMQHKKQL